MRIDELQQWAWKNNEKSGFHEDRPAQEQEQALLYWRSTHLFMIASEATEAMEEIRKGYFWNYYTVPGVAGVKYSSAAAAKMAYHGANVNVKPNGVPSELADIVIRVMDYCEMEGIDLEEAIIEKLEYNETRSYKHGKKF